MVGFLLAIPYLSATTTTNGPNCSTSDAGSGTVYGCWLLPKAPTGAGGSAAAPLLSTSGTTNPCVNLYSLAPTKDCGNYYSTLGTHAFNGTAGWHSYTPPTTGSTSASSQTYLNGLVTTGTGQLTFSLASGSVLERADGVAPTTSEPWRNPTNDYGYFLTTNGTSNPGITLCAGAPTGGCTGGKETAGISEIAFYWGSVDPWNKIGFCNISGTCDYFYGTDLSGFTAAQTTFGMGAGNAQSYVVDFKPTCSGICVSKPWAYITFTACDSTTTNCHPAFELDNIEFTTSTTNFPGPGGPTAVPEPTSMLLLGSGLGSIGMLLRRRLRRVSGLPAAISSR